MNGKQKKLLIRIVTALGIFVLLLLSSRLNGGGWMPWAGLCYLIPYLIAGYDIIGKAGRNIRNGQWFDENFLMCIATAAAFGIGEYAEACAVMLFYQVGELVQSCAVERSRASIAEMMQIAPEYANLETESGVEAVDPDEVEPGSVIVIRAGEKIPLDGIVIEGSSFLDSAALTGESVPRRVSPGEEVISGCVNGGSVLRVRTTKAYEDSAVARILELVENASDKKAKLERFITRFARWYTPVVTVSAVFLALIPPLLLQEAPGDWIRRACIFLIVSCPCALVISVPLGFFGGIGAASKIGVLVKGANFIEAVSEMDTLIFDKTGTLTRGEFVVHQILPSEESGLTSRELLALAAEAEQFSSHPIAQSVKHAWGMPISGDRIGAVEEISGRGICAEVDGTRLWVGNAALMQQNGFKISNAPKAGTVLYLAREEVKTGQKNPKGRYLGAIVIADRVKEGALEALRELRESGIRRMVMLSGDRREAAETIAQSLGIDEVYSELLPADKVGKVEELLKAQRGGKTIGFAGDGINDAPVLMRSDVGIAMGSLGADAAIEAADVVLMDDDLRKIGALLRISGKTMRVVKQNIVFSLSVKAAVLVLGALGLATMWEAVFGDVGVTVIAVLNSMRVLSMQKTKQKVAPAPPSEPVLPQQ